MSDVSLYKQVPPHAVMTGHTRTNAQLRAYQDLLISAQVMTEKNKLVNLEF